MKKYILFIIMAICSLTASVSGQNPSDVYLIGTSITPPKDKVTGFIKVIGELGKYDKTPPITFFIESIDINSGAMLQHFNYDTNLRPHKPQMLIKDLPLSQLDNLTVIDVDEFLKTKSREDYWLWMVANYKKVVWIIDRNDFYKSDLSLSQPDRMKLTQTRIWVEVIPEEFLSTNYVKKANKK